MNELTSTMAEGELRILDVDLAKRLGYARPVSIRYPIKRHLASLAELGAIHTACIAGQGARHDPTEITPMPTTKAKPKTTSHTTITKTVPAYRATDLTFSQPKP